MGLKFLKNRRNPEAFEPAPTAEVATPVAATPAPVSGGIESYSVKVDGQVYDVEVGPQGELTSVAPSAKPAQAAQAAPVAASDAEAVPAHWRVTSLKLTFRRVLRLLKATFCLS